VTLRYLGGSSERRRRWENGPTPTFYQNFLNGTSLPPGSTFTRGTIGTIYNQSGLVAYAPSNLFTYSQDFTNAAWSPSGASVSGTLYTAPDGSLTANKLVENSASGVPHLFNRLSATVGANQTLSVYAKAGERSQIALQIGASASYFDLSAGTIVSGPGVIQAIGNGWYRCSIYGSNLANANSQIYLAVSGSATYNGDGVSGAYFWGAQLEQSPTATTYTPTTSAAVYGPRFDYDPTPANVLQQNFFPQGGSPAATYFYAGVSGVYQNVTQAPDGTYTAWRVVEDTSTGTHYTGPNTFAPTVGRTYTWSWYVKASGRTFFNIQGAGTNGGGYFFNADLTAGTISAAPPGATMTPVGNGWYYCQFTFTATVASAVFINMCNALSISSYTGDGVSGLYFWGFQVSQTAAPLPYLPTGATAQTICPPRGLLIEESRTNLCLQSGNIAASPWGGADTTATANSTVSPDGTTNAALLTEGSAGTATWFQGGMTITANATVTASIYLKRNNHDWVFLLCSDAGAANGFKCWVNLNTGAIGTTGVNGTGTFTSSSIQNVGNGWYRVTITGITSATNTSAYFYTTSATADNSVVRVSGGARYIFGAQVEAGLFLTSYISTAAASVTRNADNLSITGTNFSSWYNSNAGTFVVCFDFNNSVVINAAGLVEFDDGTVTNRSLLYRGTGGQVFSYRNATNVAIGTPALPNITNKSAYAYDTSTTVSANLNGNAPTTLTAAPPTGINRVVFGFNQSGTPVNYINGHIQSFQYYNYVLPTAQLQQVTLPAYIPSPNYTLNFLTGSLPTGLTFTRATTATYYNVSGTLVSATSGTPRFEYDPNPATYSQQNLLKYSQQLTNGIWPVDNSGAPAVNPIVSASSAQAPDGTATATEVVLNRSTGTYSRVQQVFAGLIGTPYTFSVWMKTVSGGTSNVGIRLDAIGQNCVVTGTWQRFSITVSPTVVNPAAQILLYSSIAGNDQFADILVWGAQVNIGSTALPYLATTLTGTIIATAKGLLIEESRTNLQLNSTTGASWAATNATSTANAVVAPDGTTTATSVIESATGPLGHYFQSQLANTLTNATAYTTSVYAKANGRTFVCVQGDIQGGFLGSPQFFDLGAGAVVTPLATGVTSAAIQPVGNGWYRCSVTATSTGTTSAVGVWLATNGTTNNYTGDGVSGAYFWGAQQELGAFSTSYMPTTSSTFTRNADDCVMTGTNFSSWYNANAGTFVTSYDKTQAATSSGVVNVDDGTSTNRQVIYHTGTTNVMTVIRNATTASFGTPSLTTVNKVAYAYGGSTVTGLINGVATASLSASIPTGINRLVIGAVAGSANYLNGHIQYMNYYNVTLNLTQLPSLTT
jgi:hypothetical protein